MSDPYDCTLPPGWTARQDGDAVAYTNPEGTRRVTVTELSRGLSLFWWVDAARRPTPSADWEPVSTDASESFRDPKRAVRSAETVVARFAEEVGVAEADSSGAVADGG